MDKLMEILQTTIEYSFKWGQQDPIAGKIQAWVIAAFYLVMTEQAGSVMSWAMKYLKGLVHAVV